MRRWLLAAGCFTAVAILFTGEVRADYWYVGRQLSWLRAFGISLIDWEPWTLLTPVVLWLLATVPLDRARLGRALAIHVLVSLALATITLIAQALILRGVMGPEPLPGGIGRIYLGLLTYWVIIGVAMYADQRRVSRERELHAAKLETQLARAQIDALKMQLHPHFLFNTLNAVSGLMREDVEAADVMIAQLSELLRATLEAEDTPEVTLAEETRWLRTYLAIQQTRFGPRLQIVIDIPDACLAAMVPALILQPIVENAIRHGFSAMPGPGRVSIAARQVDGALRIDVTDEGPGVAQPIREGLGLRNTRSRLQALYRNKGALLVGPGPDGRGTLSRLELPLRMAASI